MQKPMQNQTPQSRECIETHKIAMASTNKNITWMPCSKKQRKKNKMKKIKTNNHRKIGHQQRNTKNQSFQETIGHWHTEMTNTKPNKNDHTKMHSQIKRINRIPNQTKTTTQKTITQKTMAHNTQRTNCNTLWHADVEFEKKSAHTIAMHKRSKNAMHTLLKNTIQFDTEIHNPRKSTRIFTHEMRIKNRHTQPQRTNAPNVQPWAVLVDSAYDLGDSHW